MPSRRWLCSWRLVPCFPMSPTDQRCHVQARLLPDPSCWEAGPPSSSTLHTQCQLADGCAVGAVPALPHVAHRPALPPAGAPPAFLLGRRAPLMLHHCPRDANLLMAVLSALFPLPHVADRPALPPAGAAPASPLLLGSRAPFIPSPYTRKANSLMAVLSALFLRYPVSRTDPRCHLQARLTSCCWGAGHHSCSTHNANLASRLCTPCSVMSFALRCCHL